MEIWIIGRKGACLAGSGVAGTFSSMYMKISVKKKRGKTVRTLGESWFFCLVHSNQKIYTQFESTNNIFGRGGAINGGVAYTWLVEGTQAGAGGDAI